MNKLCVLKINIIILEFVKYIVSVFFLNEKSIAIIIIDNNIYLRELTSLSKTHIVLTTW